MTRLVNGLPPTQLAEKAVRADLRNLIRREVEDRITSALVDADEGRTIGRLPSLQTKTGCSCKRFKQKRIFAAHGRSRPTG